jgi:hypothetical protein
MVVSINGECPRAGWFTMESPIKIRMDYLEVPPFQETSDQGLYVD